MITFSMKGSVGYKIFPLLRQWKLLSLMALFDALFFVAVYAFASFFDIILKVYETDLSGSWKAYLLLLVYFILLVSAYSFFKYSLLTFVDDLFIGKNKTFSFGRFKTFFLYNTILLFVLTTVFLFLVFFFSVSLAPVLKKTGISLFTLLFLMFSYVFVQMSHAVFMQKKTDVQKIPYAVWGMFSWIFFFSYALWNLAFAALFFLIFGLLLFALQQISGQTLVGQGWYIGFYGLNVLVFLFILCSLYFFIVWNRLYLYSVVNNKLYIQTKNHDLH